MAIYRKLDTFEQPPRVGEAFGRFVEAQAASLNDHNQAQLYGDAYVRQVGTWGGNTRPEVIYPGESLVAGVTYDTHGNLRELALRTFPTPEARTQYFTQYIQHTEWGNLVVAREINHADYEYLNGIERELQGTPQALATLLGAEPFPRGLVERGNQHIYGLVGEEEFRALGQFLVGHEL